MRIQNITGHFVPIPKINKAQLARFTMGNYKILKYLKDFVENKHLPILLRKWGKIQ